MVSASDKIQTWQMIQPTLRDKETQKAVPGKIEKKEKTMTNSRSLRWVVLIFLTSMFLVTSPVLSSSETPASSQQQEKTADQQKGGQAYS